MLYADDLVLFLLTEEGLQRNINKVKDFYNKWGLVINTDKSKIMTFSKTGRLTKNKFKFNIDNDELEYVKQYKYLGVIFSSNGKFSATEKTLSMKANRALFSIKQGFLTNLSNRLQCCIYLMH